MTTLVQPKSMQVSVNGLDLHYLDWGNAGAPPVVCVHGYTSSAEAFNALARQFHERFHIVAPDVRGHGESAWSPDGAYQYRDQVADLAGLVDQLGLARFTLIGTSMGGIIAMAFAAAHAARLVGLVINDIGPDVEEGSQRITQMVGGRPDEFATLEDAMAYRREISPVTASRPMSDQRRLPSACFASKQMAGGSGRWTPRTSGSGSSMARRHAPPSGPCSRACPAPPWSCGARRVTFSWRRRPGAWWASCPAGSW